MRKELLLLWGFLVILCFRDVYGGCFSALGMESVQGKVKIKDEQITASSSRTRASRPASARLEGGGWCPKESDHSPYIQIDLLTPHTITELVTQGALSNYVEYFRLAFSYDNLTWFNYAVNGKVKVFRGNRNTFMPKSNNLTEPLTARLIRLHPILSKSKDVAPCLRLELYGCQPSEDCKTPVGLEDRRITNKQMSASSHWNNHYAFNARLNNKAGNHGGQFNWGGWCTDKEDKNQYLQVDLGRVRSVSGVATQGYMAEMYVSKYHLNYSTDGLTWRSYRERGESRSKVFQGNFDNETVIKRFLSHRIFARYIRFNPLAWNEGGFICLRVEVYECLPTKGSVPEVNPPSETVELNRTSSVNLTCLVTGQPGAHMEWYQNGLVIPSPPPAGVFSNGSVKSVLTLSRVKYKDRGSVLSCTAWYPGLPINATRNIHLLVHAPRPEVVITDVQSRTLLILVKDPTPTDTAKYLVRYRKRSAYWDWLQVERNKTSRGDDIMITLDGLHPYTTYVVEVASHYTDDDEGPFSMPHSFETKEAAPSGPPRDVVIIPRGKSDIRVSWFIPSAEHSNGKIASYEVILYKPNGEVDTFESKEKLSQDIKGLEINQKYYIGVRAYTRVGPGPYSKNITYSIEESSEGSKITRALEKLNKVPVTDANAAKVMKEVKNITAKSSDLQEKDISITANILQNVVKTNRTSSDVGDHVLDTISHVMDAKTDVLQKTRYKYNTSAKFVKLLDEYIDKGGQFSRSTRNLAVHEQLIKGNSNGVSLSVQTTQNSIGFNASTNASRGENSENEASVTVPNSALKTEENATLIVVYYRTSKLFSPRYSPERKTEVCEDGFTAEKVSKFQRKASRYTMENSTGDVITESSPVLAASLRKRHVFNLTSPVIIKFKMPHEQIIEKSTRCVWWDFKKDGWSTAGCSLRGIVNDTVICYCDHMTNFAVLVDVEAHTSKACGKHSMVLSLISYFGCVLSILGLSLTIFTFSFFKKLRKDQIAAKILLHLCVSLLCVLIVFVAGVERGGMAEDACRVVAALIHYFLLVAFLWMLIEAYFMYQAFVKVFRDFGDYVIWKCSALAWGVPLLVVLINLGVDKSSYGGENYCRIGDVAFFAAFMTPVAFVIFVNTLTFLLIMYKLATRPPNAADPDRTSQGLLKIKRAFGILILVGITWMFGFFAVREARLVFQYLFAIFNSLQGFAIFLFYCVIQKKVRECWWALLTCNLGSLKKSKSLYTDSYDRRRLSSASRVQLDAMRARSNTALSQVLQMPLRKVSSFPDVIVSKGSANNVNYHSNMVYEDERTQLPIVAIEPSDYQLSGSEGIEIDESMDELSSRSASRSPSLQSRSITVTQCGEPVTHSRAPSIRSCQLTVNSEHTTPKLFRLPVKRINSQRSVGALIWPRECMRAKETLKRTASHTPEVQRPANPSSSLRRTRSACSFDDARFSAEFSICSDQTSCETLSSEAQTPTVKKYLATPFENLGTQIIGPQRGSIRGIVGYVETTVENFDLLIDLEKKRSLSSPEHSIHHV